MEHLSTEVKQQSVRLTRLFDTPTKESIPMLEVESSMMEMEKFGYAIENHISNLPPAL